MEIRLEKFRHGGKIVAMGVENKWKKFRFGGEFLSGGYETSSVAWKLRHPLFYVDPLIEYCEYRRN